MKKRILLIILAIIVMAFLSATAEGRPIKSTRADVNISGVVTDSRGIPIPGVSVVIKNFSSRGTATNSDGAYSLSVPENSIVIFRAIR